MKATTLLQFALLVLPVLGDEDCSRTTVQDCTVGFRCQCTYSGTENRCAAGVYRYDGVTERCRCPAKYYGHPLDKTCCIDIGKYNGRYKCTDAPHDVVVW
ncbi:hypothetical protein Ptr902_01952 [Pyrenophora tritici-repentis]|nr:hypothetical protein Ptr902_01952 [Pyrenophora tritici-repentis]